MTSGLHQPVMLQECIDALNIQPNGVYMDGTFGRGGHSQAILSQLQHGRLIVIDKDPEAIKTAKSLLGEDERVTIIHDSFSKLQAIAESEHVSGEVDGILLDLGVSSPQLDEAERGFSFMQDGPLDMRMDTTQGQTAKDLLMSVDADTLAQIFRDYGEERFAGRIAQAIVSQFEVQPLDSTLALAKLIEKSSPKREKNKHPATRCFQALRIAVNNELQDLQQAMEGAVEVLKAGGRLCCLSFHSLEDRIVKQFMRREAKGESLPPGMPLRQSEIKKTERLKLIGKPIRASLEEVQHNVRARSVTLRTAERLS